MATKKRAEEGSDGGGAQPKKAAPRGGTAKRPASKRGVAPRIRASHGGMPTLPKAGSGGGSRPAATGGRSGPAKTREPAGEARAPRSRRPAQGAPIASETGTPSRGPRPRKAPGTARGAGAGQAVPAPSAASAPAPRAPLAGPKRATPRRPAQTAPQPSDASRELALALAAAGLDKKAIGVEILEVAGRVDYADYLVIMTGRSDRHVHAIATGLEDAMRNRKTAPLSVEGLTAATWVLLDFGDVVVHVFQEDARRLYDIEGLWIDAGRVPVPSEEPTPAREGDGDPDLRITRRLDPS